MVAATQKISKQEALTFLQTAFAGGTAGAVTRAVAQPLDVLKIRFQLQLEPIREGSKYCSILQATKSIVQEEGIRTLWSGHIPAQLLSVSYGILQFSSFEYLLKLCQQSNSKFFNTNRNGINFSCGAIAATFSTVASFPFDTVRTRLIAEQKTHKAYKGFTHAFTYIIKREGYLALFKGLMPTLAQIAPHAGLQFAVYRFLTDSVFSKMSMFQRRKTIATSFESTLVANLLAGSLAGFFAKSAIYPFDLVKKRLQIQGFQEYRKGFGKQMYCNGLLDCVKLTITEEGFLALYKGYWPSVLKALLVSALHFAVYDEIKHILSAKKS